MKFIKVFDVAGEPVIIPHDEITMIVEARLPLRDGKFALIHRKSFGPLQTLHSINNVERFLRD